MVGIDQLLFSKFDYTIFGLMLGISTLLGVYFGFFAKQKQDNTVEYLLGSKNMKVWPIAISLTATHISAVTLLGVPAEVYDYGTHYAACLLSGLIVTIGMSYVYLPVFYDLQITSCYIYLSKRYDLKMRALASSLYALMMILNIPIMIYAPAIAFSQVTGVNLHVITPIMCTICIFYTTFGGLRAVVWADTLQFSAMTGAICVIMVLGTNYLGGIAEVFSKNDGGGRLIYADTNPDPFLRSSFWMVTVGLSTLWMSAIGVSPDSLQRFLAVPTLKDSRKVVWIFGIGHIIIKLASVYNGLLIYGKYRGCDPVTTGEVQKLDQIFPFYVMDIAKSVPGLPGLFVAGVFSAALSSMSSCLNTLSGTMFVDFIKPRYPQASEKTASTIMKTIVVVVGLLCWALVYVVEILGNIFSLAISVIGAMAGTLLGIFTMGMTLPKANAKGAWWGAMTSLITVSIMTLGAQTYVIGGQLKYESLPIRVDECEASFNVTSLPIHFTSQNNITTYIRNDGIDNLQVPWIFRISFMYYSIIGTIIVFAVGYPVSLLTGGNENIDERLLTPLIRPFYRKPLKEVNGIVYTEVPQNLEIQKLSGSIKNGDDKCNIISSTTT